MTKAELIKLRAEALEKARSVRSNAEVDGGELSAENLTEIKALILEAQGYKAKIDDVVANESVLSDLDSALGSLELPSPRRAAANPIATVTNVRERFMDDPKKGFKSHNHFLLDVMKYENHREKAPANLKYLAVAGTDEQSTFDDTKGGFLLPTGFSPNVLKIDPEDDPTAGRTTMIPMGNPTIDIPARVDKDHSTSVSGGLTVSRKPEGLVGTSSQMSFEQVHLKVSTLFGLAYATDELLQDSPQSFTAIISSGFSDQFTDHMIDEKLNGTGAGEYLGVNNSPALITVAKEGGQKADTILFKNIVQMRSRAWKYGNCIWMANHDTMPQMFLLNQVVGTGGTPIFSTDASRDIPDQLLGRPLVFTEYTETVGDAGDLLLINWAEYLEGILQPMQSAESIHVRFINNETAFKFWTRNAGTGWWRTVLTPKKSSITRSPFIRLAERT